MARKSAAKARRCPTQVNVECPMVHAGVKGGRSTAVGVMTMSRGETNAPGAAGRAKRSSRPGRIGSQQVLGVTTPLREGRGDTEGLMGDDEDWVAGLAED